VVKNLTDILTDPLFRQREMVHGYQGENGEKRHGFGIPVKLSETPGAIKTRPAGFGEQTRKILEETGYSTEQIDTFFAGGVV
jgi:crotonobetainyl-CoA:carnitine CoA-transferase CaiB-like acyl-CoA transferase